MARRPARRCSSNSSSRPSRRQRRARWCSRWRSRQRQLPRPPRRQLRGPSPRVRPLRSARSVCKPKRRSRSAWRPSNGPRKRLRRRQKRRPRKTRRIHLMSARRVKKALRPDTEMRIRNRNILKMKSKPSLKRIPRKGKASRQRLLGRLCPPRSPRGGALAAHCRRRGRGVHAADAQI